MPIMPANTRRMIIPARAHTPNHSLACVAVVADTAVADKTAVDWYMVVTVAVVAAVVLARSCLRWFTE